MALFIVERVGAGFTVRSGENTLQAAASALKAAAWAEGTLPGGAGTKSAKEWSEDSAASAASLDDRLSAIGPDGVFQVQFGAPGSGMSAGIYDSGVWEFFLGVVKMALADQTGAQAGAIEVKTDSGEWVFSISDTTTGTLLFGIHKWLGVWSYEGQISGSSASSAVEPALPAIENQHYLRQFIAGCGTLLDGGSALVHVMLDGDSWLDGKAYGSSTFVERFYATTGLVNAGLGWIGLAAAAEDGTAHGDALASVTITRDNTASWTDLFPSTSVSPGTSQNFPGYAAVQAAASNAVMTIACPALSDQTSLTLYCGKGAGVEQSWDGSSWSAVTVAAGTGSTTATIDMTGKTDTLRLRVSSGTVLSGLFGLSAASGVVFSNLASSGSTAEQHAAVQANADYQAMLTALPGDVHVAMLQLGLNDAKSSSVTAQICADWITEVRDGYRTAFPGCDVAYACQPDTYLNTGFNMDDLALLLRTDARTSGCAVLDLQAFFGPVQSGTTYAGYAYASDIPLLGPDDRHPSLVGETGAVHGAKVIAQAYSNLFIPIAKGF